MHAYIYEVPILYVYLVGLAVSSGGLSLKYFTKASGLPSFKSYVHTCIYIQLGVGAHGRTIDSTPSSIGFSGLLEDLEFIGCVAFFGIRFYQIYISKPIYKSFISTGVTANPNSIIFLAVVRNHYH